MRRGNPPVVARVVGQYLPAVSRCIVGATPRGPTRRPAPTDVASGRYIAIMAAYRLVYGVCAHYTNGAIIVSQCRAGPSVAAEVASDGTRCFRRRHHPPGITHRHLAAPSSAARDTDRWLWRPRRAALHRHRQRRCRARAAPGSGRAAPGSGQAAPPAPWPD